MKKEMKNSLNARNRHGFSFIESMLAVAVVSIGLSAALPLFTSGIVESNDSRDQVIAAMLAQEGVELMQNFRDNNWVSLGEAFSDTTFPDQSSEDCRISYDSAALNECDVTGDKKMYLNSGYYTHVSSIASTKFQRKIFVKYKDGAGNDISLRSSAESVEITSVVIWGSYPFPDYGSIHTSCNTSKRCSFAETILTKWAER
jgi:prepilin-type N-terminal cleavage/methylation domain-containing protein